MQLSADRPNADQVKLARALVNPDKSTRDKTIASIKQFLSSVDVLSDLEMLKLWKALYYCMWLSDKAPVQEELARSLSSLMRCCKTSSMLVLYISCFYRTMLREWSYLDQYRVDKFYKIIRFILRESLSYLHEQSWPRKLTNRLMSLVETEVLTKTPNGIRFHIADIFIPELLKVSGGSMNTRNLMLCLAPFFRVLAASEDNTFHERVTKKVFVAFIKEFVISKNVSTSDVEQAASADVFRNVDAKVIQGRVFSIAADDGTLEKNRKKIYDLHKEFPPVTGVAFANEEELKSEEAEVSISDSRIDSDSGAMKDKKSKVKKRKADIIEEDSGMIPPPSAQESADWMTDTDNDTIDAAFADTQENELVVQSQKKIKKKNPKKKNDEKDEDVAAAYMKSKKPSALMTQSPSSSLPKSAPTSAPAAEVTTEVVTGNPAPFIASQKFSGPKPGYAFKKSKSGQGYYLDPREQNKLKKATKGSHSTANATDVAAANVVDKHVHFGAPQSKGYIHSVNGLKASAAADLVNLSSPTKGVLKVKTKQFPASASKAVMSSGGGHHGNTDAMAPGAKRRRESYPPTTAAGTPKRPKAADFMHSGL